MNKIKRFFTDKRFIYGSGSVALVTGFIAIAVLVNIIVGTLSDKFTLKLDLTENKIFNLSEQTINIVKAINEPVDVILLESADSEDTETKELVQRYISLNNNLKLRITDPVSNPTSVQKYSKLGSNIGVGSIIFDNGKKFKVVSYSDLRMSYSPQGQQAQQQQQEQFFQAENKLTSSLISLSKSSDITIAFTDGHGEDAITAAEQILKDDSINVEKVSTLSEGFSDKYDLYMIVSPKTDFTTEEIDSFDKYLKSGKNAQVYFDVQSPQLPKLESYLSDMGIVAQRNLVFEGDNKKIVFNQPYSFIATPKEHPITKAIVSSGVNVISYASMPIIPQWDEKNSIKIVPILESSSKSYTVSQDGTKTDAQGPFALALVATRNNEDKTQSKLFVMGSSAFFQIEQLLTNNKDFFLGSINWQIDNTESINIRPKSLSSSKLEMNQQDLIIWGIVLVIFIPIAVLVFGLATWLRRRHL